MNLLHFCLKRLSAAWMVPFLVLLAGPAFAAGNTIQGPGGSAWTIYAFGNAQTVADALRAVANFSASPVFKSIVAMIAVVGIIVVGLSSGFSSAVARKFIGYIVAVFIVTYVFFGVKNDGPLVVNVEVIDSVTGTWVAPVTVPAVVGIPAALMSTAGQQITKQIEASFSIPDELKMSNGAPFNLATAMVNDASKARVTDSNLASSLAYYVQDCFTIGVAQGQLSAQSLLSSTDFINDIKFNNQAIMVNTLLLDGRVGTSSVTSCANAWALIDTEIKKNGTEAAGYLRNASAWARTPALSVVNSAADAVAQWSSNGGVTNGGAFVKQAAVLSTFNGAFKQASAATGNSEFLTGLASAQAYESQRSSWIMGAEIFNRTMGYIYAVLQVLIYAITPLMLAAALIPGLGMALLKSFGQVLLWMAIWTPMLAIVNFIVLSMQQADLGGVLNNGNGAYGFTLQSMGIITEKTSNMRAAAVFVGTMVPALAWAMVKGSVDFSRVIGSAVGENFAAQAANTVSTGNYSLNQASMDSFTANKHSVGHNGNWGHGMTNTDQGAFQHQREMGGPSGAKLLGDQMKASATAREGTGNSVGLNNGMTGTSGADKSQGGGDTAQGSRTGSQALAVVQNQAVQISDSIGGGVNAGAALIKPNPGVANAPSAMPGAGAGAGAGGVPGQSPAAPQFEKPGQTRFSANLTGQAGVARNASKGDAFQKTNQDVNQGSVGKTLVDSTTTKEGVSQTDGTTRGVQATSGVDNTISGPGGRAAIDAANAAASHFSSRFDRNAGGDQNSFANRWARGDTFDKVSETVGKVVDPNYVQNSTAKIANDVDNKERSLSAQEKELEREALAKKAAAERLANANLQQGAGPANDKTVQNRSRDAVLNAPETIRNMADAAKERLQGLQAEGKERIQDMLDANPNATTAALPNAELALGGGMLPPKQSR